MAALAETSARTATAIVVTIPTIFIFSMGNVLTTLSANPTVYNATDNACARYNGIPIAPPDSIPSERLII